MTSTESLTSKEIVERFLLDAFGERCADPYSPMCAKCVAWDHFDNWRPPDEPSVGVTRLRTNNSYIAPVSDRVDELVNELQRQGMASLRASFKGMRVRIDSEEDRPAEPPTTSPFEFCVFIGDPPSGYASWSDWAAEPTKRYVTIRASETKSEREQEPPFGTALHGTCDQCCATSHSLTRKEERLLCQECLCRA